MQLKYYARYLTLGWIKEVKKSMWTVYVYPKDNTGLGPFRKESWTGPKAED